MHELDNFFCRSEQFALVQLGEGVSRFLQVEVFNLAQDPVLLFDHQIRLKQLNEFHDSVGRNAEMLVNQA